MASSGVVRPYVASPYIGARPPSLLLRPASPEARCLSARRICGPIHIRPLTSNVPPRATATRVQPWPLVVRGKRDLLSYECKKPSMIYYIELLPS
eukprot:scaffold60798_cov30-Tisochrysis_lutea.AAC.2